MTVVRLFPLFQLPRTSSRCRGAVEGETAAALCAFQSLSVTVPTHAGLTELPEWTFNRTTPHSVTVSERKLGSCSRLGDGSCFACNAEQSTVFAGV